APSAAIATLGQTRLPSQSTTRAVSVCGNSPATSSKRQQVSENGETETGDPPAAAKAATSSSPTGVSERVTIQDFSCGSERTVASSPITPFTRKGELNSPKDEIYYSCILQPSYP